MPPAMQICFSSLAFPFIVVVCCYWFHDLAAKINSPVSACLLELLFFNKLFGSLIAVRHCSVKKKKMTIRDKELSGC